MMLEFMARKLSALILTLIMGIILQGAIPARASVELAIEEHAVTRVAFGLPIGLSIEQPSQHGRSHRSDGNISMIQAKCQGALGE
ncbi:hypothetical protein [Paracoccus jiaweipingae]|uniref:hypothetical protein n=1 Tax=Paracoccus sp. p2-l61 TaxID=3366950 RepID=UPI00379F492B